MFNIACEIHPNNETRLCLYPAKTNFVRLKEQAATLLGTSTSEVEEKNSTTSNVTSKKLPLVIRSEFRTICSAHSHNRTHFGMDASRRIMRAGGAMDHNDRESQNYLFITATLPADDEWAKWAIAEDAHNLVDGLKSWLSKRMGNRLEFYVWEHQQRAALHLHYCVYMPDPKLRAWVKREFRREWMRLLHGTEKRLGVSMWGKWASKPDRYKHAILRTDVQEVRQSVAAYMAGYCNGVDSKHKDDRLKDYYPKRWFGVSRPLSTLIKQYSEKEVTEYPSYRIAKIAFDEMRRENEQDSCHTVNYRHNVGRGESNVTYHTPEIQAQLWQARKQMKYSHKSHPKVYSWLQTAYRILLMCGELEEKSQLYRASVSKESRDVLQDVLYRDSLRKGTLHKKILSGITDLYLGLGSNSSLPHSILPLLRNVRHFLMIESRAYPLLHWDKYGYLATTEDFPDTVDKVAEEEDTRTNTDEVDVPEHDGENLAPSKEHTLPSCPSPSQTSQPQAQQLTLPHSYFTGANSQQSKQQRPS